MTMQEIDDYQLLKYLRNQSSPEERVRVLEWLAQSEDNRKVYFRLKALWFALKADSYADNAKLEQSLASMRQRLNKSQRRIRFLWTIYDGVVSIFRSRSNK